MLCTFSRENSAQLLNNTNFEDKTLLADYRERNGTEFSV